MIELRKIISLIVSITFAMHSFAQERTDPSTQNKELGKVSWYRNYDEAVTIAKKEKKDIIILFQEVPGCATCLGYGYNVLSLPLMVEAIENSFIPLVIHNNKSGHDKKILEKFNEPSWNNPVVRIIDTEGKDIVKRIGNDYSALTLAKRLKEALTVRKTPIPKYIDLLEDELNSLNSNDIKEANFKMYCFWTGEKQLGKLDGVIDVEAGFIGHSEVVKVKYNTTIINEAELNSYARKQNFQPIDQAANYETATNDVHYYLLNSTYKYLPLTELQKTKINSALGSNQQANIYLSPKQIKWLNYLKNNQVKDFDSLISVQKIEDAWASMETSYIKSSTK